MNNFDDLTRVAAGLGYLIEPDGDGFSVYDPNRHHRPVRALTFAEMERWLTDEIEQPELHGWGKTAVK
jgi:hypothetical protein